MKKTNYKIRVAGFKPDDMKKCDEYVAKLNTVFHDKNTPFNDRMTAGILLTGFGLGFRASELCLLKKDCLGYDLDSKPQITPPMKRLYHPGTGRTKFYCGPEQEQVLKEMLELRKQCAGAEASPYLYVLDRKREDEGAEPKPVRKEILGMKFRKLCGKDANLYMLRMYFVWTVCRMKITIEDVHWLLNHKNRNSFSRYI